MLVALDAKTGKEVWKAPVEDYTHGYYMSLAPLVADGKVMVGVSGGELGVRGFVAAFDAETGKPALEDLHRAGARRAGQRDLAEGRPVEDRRRLGVDHRQLRSGDQPQPSGAPAMAGRGWATSGRATISTPPRCSRSTPRPARSRAITSIIPNDSWDWDEVSPPILVDYQHDGKTIKGLVDVARDGYLWMLERTGDKINFVDGKPFVKQNVFSKSRSRRPGGRMSIPAASPATGKKADFCPSLWGGKDWPPVAYSPKTRLLYIPANENLCGTITGGAGHLHAGTALCRGDHDAVYRAGRRPHRRTAGLEPRHRQKVWSHPFATSQLWGPVLATGGGVVFAGGTNDRYFRAFDASNGKTLWEFRTSSGVNGVPVSFQLDGKQYIAVQSGWGVDAARMQARLNLVRPWEYPRCAARRLGLGVRRRLTPASAEGRQVLSGRPLRCMREGLRNRLEGGLGFQIGIKRQRPRRHAIGTPFRFMGLFPDDPAVPIRQSPGHHYLNRRFVERSVEEAAVGIGHQTGPEPLRLPARFRR